MLKTIAITIVCIIALNAGMVSFASTVEAISSDTKSEVGMSTGQVISGAGMTIAVISALGALMDQSATSAIYAAGLISGVAVMIIGNAMSGTQ